MQKKQLSLDHRDFIPFKSEIDVVSYLRKQLSLELRLHVIARMLSSLLTDAIATLTPEEIPLIRSLLS